jgi:hypothetical protein
LVVTSQYRCGIDANNCKPRAVRPSRRHTGTGPSFVDEDHVAGIEGQGWPPGDQFQYHRTVLDQTGLVIARMAPAWV